MGRDVPCYGGRLILCVGWRGLMGLSIYNQKSNRWREAYNPLRGLTIPKLVSLRAVGGRQ